MSITDPRLHVSAGQGGGGTCDWAKSVLNSHFESCALDFSRLIRRIPHSGLKRSNAFADGFSQFRQTFWSEDKKRKYEECEQVHGLKESVEHRNQLQ